MITYKRTKTTDFFYKINLIVYLFGLPYFWIRDLRLPKRFISVYNRFTIFNNLLICILILLELGAFFTQHNLTAKQKFNLLMYGLSHPILYFFREIMAHHKESIRGLFYDLTVGLKAVHNDLKVEKQMVTRTMMYLSALLCSCVLSMFAYTIDAWLEVVRTGATFTTIITVWPDVDDVSSLASVFRVVSNVVWWIFVTRIIGVYFLVIPLTTCLSYQYRNLQSYFYKLNDVFEMHYLTQKEKEEKYEQAFKIGIKLHSATLRCTNQCQTVCGSVFSGQIIFNILVLVVLMAQMVNSERTLVNLCATVSTASAVLISTGFFMWNSGDVTVEASHLATAMYFSGWHNCFRDSSVRVRKLVVVAMSHAQVSDCSAPVFFNLWVVTSRGGVALPYPGDRRQKKKKPVVLKGLGYIDLSYQSYIKIVKLSYSVFSVLY